MSERWTHEKLETAVSILRKYRVRDYDAARDEIAAATGLNASTYNLAHAFRHKGYRPPTSYCSDAATAARAGVRHAADDMGNAHGVGDNRPGVRVEYRDPDKNIEIPIKGSQRGATAAESDPRKDPALHAPQAPKGYHLRGVSTLLDGAGNPVQQWVKTTQDKDADNLDRLLDALKSLPENYSQHHEPVKPPEHTMADLLAVYPVGDPHLGMFAWCEETGANYDVRIAERLHVQAIKHLVAGAPAAKQALVISLGDFFHVNNDLARTERNGNPLDTDSRFAKVLRVGVGMFTAMIDAALEKHDRVRVICEVGNHDAQASMMLALAMDTFYARDERVSVDTSPARFHYHRFGKCLFGTTHGDGAKADRLPQIMASDRAPDWGQTTYRKWFVGHVHTDRVLCYPGCRVEHYRTLAGRDAWAHGEGYRSDRGMGVEYYHREHGYVGNGYVPLSLLEAA